MLPNFRLIPLLIALSSTAAMGPAVAQRIQTVRNGDHIVAVVNTESVTAIEVEQRMARGRAEAQRANVKLPSDDELRKQALDSLIEERVLLTYARESGNRIDDVELDRAVANVASQNQLSTAQLRDRLKSEGVDYVQFRNNLRDQMLLERVREREVTSRIKVADVDIDRLVEQQRTEASGDLEINLAQILITVPEGANDSVVAQRRALAEKALARVQKGENFAAVAGEVSEDGNRAAGGEIGRRALRRLPDLFVEATRNLSVGQVSPQLLRSPAGFHVLKVLDRDAQGAFKVTQTRARHILLRVSERAPAQAVASRLESVRRQIDRGERKFEDVAKELSEDGSAANGGDLGWASPGQFVPEFEEALNRLAPGAISPPVTSRFGVHLIQVVERRDTTIDPKDVREQARNVLREQKFEQTYVDWAKDLRLRAYVEMRDAPQ
jgi:peptidyl-prolyl cis-trans isomerase SurA